VSVEPLEFQMRYGPWAVVAGASEGVGLALARAVAARGVNVALLARRQAVLDEAAASIHADWGVQARAVTVDFTEPDAMTSIAEATAGLEVGLLALCAGADTRYERFLDSTVDGALDMVQRNAAFPLAACHHFAGPMAARGRGGIVLFGSGAGLVGGPNMATYAATKAFDIVLGEGLWAELHDAGVDVLSLVLGPTDTPSLRQLLVRLGARPVPDDEPVPGAACAADVAEEALLHLPDGPTWFVGEVLREGSKYLGSIGRSEAVRMVMGLGVAVLGITEEPAR